MLSGVTHLDEAGNLGVLEDSLDPSARFDSNYSTTMSAQRACVHLDTASHLQRALLCNAAVQDRTQSRRSCSVSSWQSSGWNSLAHSATYH